MVGFIIKNIKRCFKPAWWSHITAFLIFYIAIAGFPLLVCASPNKNEELTGPVSPASTIVVYFDNLTDLESFAKGYYQPLVVAQAPVIPDAGKSGISEKFLVPPTPLKLPEKEKLPEIIIEDSREVIDAGAGPTFFVKRVEIEGNTLFDAKTLAPLVDVGEGLETTLGVLMLMAQDIAAFYSEKGYFLAQAFIPQQEVKDGVVKLTILEGKINKVEVRGNKKIDSQDLSDRMQPVKNELVVNEQTLERTLKELNETLGVTVKSVLRPGDLPGTSDLILDVTEKLPYTFGFDADNFGSRFTGRDRYGANVSAGNNLFFGDQFYIRGVRSDLGQISLSPYYLLPVNNYGTTLKFGYSYSEQRLGDSLASLSAGGNSHLSNLEAAHTVFRSRTTQLKVRIVTEYRNLNNFLNSQPSSQDKIFDSYIGFGGSYNDAYLGNNFFDLKLQHGLKNFNENSTLISRAGGSTNNYIAHADFSRYQGTGFFDTYFVLKASGQVADRRGLSPDIFPIGGYGSVRGYPLAEFTGDKGFTASLDYVIPVPWKLPLGFGGLTLNNVLSINGFIDHGETFIDFPIPGEVRHNITGVGGGITINLPKFNEWSPATTFSAGYASAHQGPIPTDGNTSTLYLNGLLSYYF